MFSWSSSSPFAIRHVDYWSSGHMTDHNMYIALMNIICDMTQFDVVVSVPDKLLLYWLGILYNMS